MKNTVALSLILAVLLALSACAPSGEPEEPLALPAPIPAAAETPAQEPAPEQETEAEIAVSLILQAADDRREEILGSATQIVKGDEYIPGEAYDGTAYYVSNGGDDAADGLTPETAWASVRRVNEARLKHGDAVFFERGGIWREQLDCREKVTYSAYGEGNKPRLYGSQQNGAGAENWSLYLEQGEMKIWLLNSPITDCAGIVFNGGEAYASRVYAFYNGEYQTSVSRPGEALDPALDLTENMQFLHACELSGAKGDYIDIFDYDTTGRLYLRMDEGNPGEIYSDIEFQTANYPTGGYVGIINGCWNDSGCVVDNLCTLYGGWVGINFFGASNSVIQNCEIGWCGGNTQTFQREGIIQAAGEGVKMEGDNIITRNNYVHDCFDGGVISEANERNFEYYGEYLGGQRITGNLIERCMSGILITHDYDAAEQPVYGDFVVEDNMIMYSGYGWSSDEKYNFTWGTEDYVGTSVTFWDNIVMNDGVYLKDNVFAFAKSSLLHCGMPDEWLPVCSGNTYIQSAGHAIGYYGRTNDVGYFHGRELRAYSFGNMEYIVTEQFRDLTAEIYYLDEVMYPA